MATPDSTEVWPMQGRTVLVTGASSGIGRATAAALGQAGALVLVHGRTSARAADTVRGLSQAPGADRSAGRFVPVTGDLGSLAGVLGLAADVRRSAPGGLHVLVNNAGAAFAERALSPDGIERTIAVNHVAVAALTAALLDALRDGATATGRPSRVVNLSSSLEKRGRPDLDDWTYPTRFSPLRAYADSKLINLAHTYTLARRLAGTGVHVNAADPGNVSTGFGRAGGLFNVVQRLGRPFLADPATGARTSIRLAGDPTLDGATGGFYRAGAPHMSSPTSRDPGFGDRVEATTATLMSSIRRAGSGPG